MNATLTRVPIDEKEAEALVWGFAQMGDYAHLKPTGPSDPLHTLREAGFGPKAIREACDILFGLACTRWLVDPFTELELLILRLAVEQSSWLDHYRRHIEDHAGNVREGQNALRSLATKFEAFGIEVNVIPQ